MSNTDAARALDNFRACADEAPAGTYEAQKAIAALIGDTCDNFMSELRALGLRADNCDLIHHVEATLYEYVKQSNPDSPLWPTAEGFGESMRGPARGRVLTQAAGNLETLRALGLA